MYWYKYIKYNTSNIFLSYCVEKNVFDDLHSLVSLNSERQTAHTHIPSKQFYDNSIIPT